MRILVIGGGGREHALCWSIAGSPLCDALFCAPGNPGIAREATCLDIPVDDQDGILRAAHDHAIDFAVVGPEQPLVAGLVDRLEAAGIRAFGPTAAAAALEGSKGFMKDLCAEHGIPTAAYGRFSEPEEALRYIAETDAPLVVKADGLAAGKGVVVTDTAAEAEAAVRAAMLDRSFGAAGSEVVIEQRLFGPEVSIFALADGTHLLPLATAQDHKRAWDGDRGPNTGGMGGFSPSPLVDEVLWHEITTRILEPTLKAMAFEGRPFKGVLYAGLILTKDGPMLLEYNARFGDPECQMLVRRLRSDLLPALVAARDGVLDSFDLRWDAGAAVTVVMANRGYPGPIDPGASIDGLDDAAEDPAVTIFHSGTAADPDGTVLAVGGRVLAVTASGQDLPDARSRAYAAVDKISFAGGWCRRDIAAGLS